MTARLDAFQPAWIGVLIAAICTLAALSLITDWARDHWTSAVMWWRAQQAQQINERTARRAANRSNVQRHRRPLPVLARTHRPFDWAIDDPLIASTPNPIHDLAGGTPLEATLHRIHGGAA